MMATSLLVVPRSMPTITSLMHCIVPIENERPQATGQAAGSPLLGVWAADGSIRTT